MALHMSTPFSLVLVSFRVAYMYVGRVLAWNVVNEVIADEPRGGVRTSFWLDSMGEEYIDMAYRFATDPEAEL